jgi:hypothetical protein
VDDPSRSECDRPHLQVGVEEKQNLLEIVARSAPVAHRRRARKPGGQAQVDRRIQSRVKKQMEKAQSAPRRR